MNQIGYYPLVDKIAVLPGNASGEFSVVDIATGNIVYTDTLSRQEYWQHSGESVAIADFSRFTSHGTYVIEHTATGRSYPFAISENIYRSLGKGALKAYYFNRASSAVGETYAGKWKRPAGHPDTAVAVHPSAASAKRPPGYVFASPKGWYDAGDYNKYIVNSGISTYTLLAAYEHFPVHFNTLETNIPETSNGVPDILDEIRWNLEWMLTMQDPDDGGVYHKLTTLRFEGIIMPHEARSQRYVVRKSTAAALNFAAVNAIAARVFASYDSGLAERCIRAAEYAWMWAVKNPEQYYRQPSDVHTGQYGDDDISDEFDWAAAELYITTGNDRYLDTYRIADTTFAVPDWRYVRPLAWISLTHHRESLAGFTGLHTAIQNLLDLADTLYREYERSAYRISMGVFGGRDFVWGSNGTAANHSLILIQAYQITGDDRYLRAALSNLDYLLGRNPTGYSFVTGFGILSPHFPHHRQSAADDIDDPVPGFLVGGPYNGQQDGCAYPSDYPALSYIDDWCSYTTNEVAINWNAPLVYIVNALEYMHAKR